MAADTGKIFACKGCVIGSAVDGVTHGKILYKPAAKRDMLTKASVVGRADVGVEIYGNNPRALTLKLGTLGASVVFSVLRDDGTTGTETLALVDLVEVVGSAEIPEADSGGKLAAFGIRGWCQGTGDLDDKWQSA